jgi:hypothetical protein
MGSREKVEVRLREDAAVQSLVIVICASNAVHYIAYS